MADNTFAFVIIFIWLIIITALIVAFGVGVWMHRIDFGPTGPTGPSQGPIGPTGPTGHSGVTTTTNLTTTFLPTTNNSNNIGCFPCQFTNLNGQISDHQTILAGKPSIIQWVINNNGLASSNESGTFILPVGTYIVSTDNIETAVVYPSVQSNGMPNNGGSYRSAAIWLREQSVNNVVSEHELIGTVTAIAIPNTSTTLTFSPNIRFNVTSTKNKLSIITWHDVNNNNINNSLEIGALSRFYLQKIA